MTCKELLLSKLRNLRIGVTTKNAMRFLGLLSISGIQRIFYSISLYMNEKICYQSTWNKWFLFFLLIQENVKKSYNNKKIRNDLENFIIIFYKQRINSFKPSFRAV